MWNPCKTRNSLILYNDCLIRNIMTWRLWYANSFIYLSWLHFALQGNMGLITSCLQSCQFPFKGYFRTLYTLDLLPRCRVMFLLHWTSALMPCLRAVLDPLRDKNPQLRTGSLTDLIALSGVKCSVWWLKPNILTLWNQFTAWTYGTFWHHELFHSSQTHVLN